MGRPAIRCIIQPESGPPLPPEERRVGWVEKPLPALPQRLKNAGLFGSVTRVAGKLVGLPFPLGFPIPNTKVMAWRMAMNPWRGPAVRYQR